MFFQTKNEPAQKVGFLADFAKICKNGRDSPWGEAWRSFWVARDKSQPKSRENRPISTPPILGRAAPISRAVFWSKMARSFKFWSKRSKTTGDTQYCPARCAPRRIKVSSDKLSQTDQNESLNSMTRTITKRPDLASKFWPFRSLRKPTKTQNFPVPSALQRERAKKSAIGDPFGENFSFWEIFSKFKGKPFKRLSFVTKIGTKPESHLVATQGCVATPLRGDRKSSFCRVMVSSWLWLIKMTIYCHPVRGTSRSEWKSS